MVPHPDTRRDVTTGGSTPAPAEVDGDARGGVDGAGGLRLAWAVVAVVLLAVIVAYARARWPGYLPLGSDNDEYQLVGQQLAAFEAPVVAGVEGTKYPLGYPAVLAVLQWLRLPVAPVALGLNLVAIGVTTGLVAWVAGRSAGRLSASPGAALAAGGVVAASVSVWNDAYSVMPEMLTLALVAGMVAVVASAADGLTPRRLVWLTVLAVIAVTMKTLAVVLVLGGCTLLAVRAVWRGTTMGSPWRMLQPAGWAVAVVLAGMAVTRSLPEHTTGYVATFFLRDPFDASQGRLGPVGLLQRAWSELGVTLADLGRPIAMIDASEEVAGVIAVVGLVLGVIGAWRLRPGGPLGAFAGGAVLAYAVAMALWPYHSSRFGVPLVPIAALGVGWLVRVVSDRLASVSLGEGWSGVVVSRVVGLLAGGVVVGALVATSFGGAVSRGEDASERLAMQHAALERLEEWAGESLGPEDEVVSFDYREVSRRLDREVQPLAYTSDVAALRAMVGDTDWIVMVDFHHTRNRQLELLLEAEPERYEQVLSGEGLGVWRVVG